MKKIIFILLFILGFEQSTFAEEVILPKMSKPAYLEEGTQRVLTQEQINELLPWAKNSKITLTDLLDEIKDLPMDQKIAHLNQGIQSVVAEGRSTSELFMRYILNRGLVLEETIKNETEDRAVGVADVKLRILVKSMQMALMLEWLAWDFYRDLDNKTYAVQITKIGNFLKTLPKEKISDTEALVYIRKMRDLQEKLSIADIIRKIEDKSSGRELKNGERVLVMGRSTGFLRSAIIYANVSDSVPGATKEDNNSHYCVKFTNPNEGERFMAYDNYVKRSDILMAFGCGERFCVGEKITERKSGDVFTIIGIDANGDYAIRSGEREMMGLMDKDLQKTK